MARTDQYTQNGSRRGRQGKRYHHQETEQKGNSTFWVVIVSLLFVAVFAGALVGGVLSGDPSSGFFITIIAASGVAIGVAATVSLRYYCQPSYDDAHPHGINKEYGGEDIRGTFPSEDDYVEDEEVAYYSRQAPGRHIAHTPVDARIKEVKAPRMAPGDVSAMSPHSYDVESYAQSEFTRSEYQGNGYRLRIKPSQEQVERRGPFDFSSVASSRQEPVREDPPEEATGGCVPMCGMIGPPKDPSAAFATADGHLVDENSDVELNSPSGMSATSRSIMSRYDVEPEIEDEKSAVASEHGSRYDTSSTVSNGRSRSKSPGRRGDAKETAPPPPPPPGPSKRKSSTKAATATPTASEAGSAVSSMFLKPFAGMFGKKRTTSEAGYSEDGSNIQGAEVYRGNGRRSSKKTSDDKSDIVPPNGKQGKPPKPDRKNKDESTRGLGTISGGYPQDRYAPSTPGNNSTYSIPPPKRIPSTPASEAVSEFRSVAASSAYTGVASSTFDPRARDRAIQRHEKNTAALGASFNDMPIYYEEDESAAVSVAPSEQPTGNVTYDVFAPAGPIGIVVDTIEKGCVVHSLKKTSPMQGLINPGDLIVALDDFDVRKMDAASLTKLMAKKSQQKERKFTLIPLEVYK